VKVFEADHLYNCLRIVSETPNGLLQNSRNLKIKPFASELKSNCIKYHAWGLQQHSKIGRKSARGN